METSLSIPKHSPFSCRKKNKKIEDHFLGADDLKTFANVKRFGVFGEVMVFDSLKKATGRLESQRSFVGVVITKVIIF